jgi:hypothetical protein
MLETFVKVKVWSWFLEVTSICKGKNFEVVPRLYKHL